tara:strand:+ start:294 stop:644 length:351 start_codon:yes stop_codon:yes gene_type:complete
MKKYLILFFVFTLISCSSAKKSSEITTKYVPASNYMNLSCEQLIAEAEVIRARTPGLAAAVDEHRKNQTGVEVVTWVLFWPAAFLLDDGSEMSSELAEAKGQLEAIQQNLYSKKCG